MLRVYRLDLHLHSCLSPCAELDMHPERLAQFALAAGLDAVAVCDHNSTENLPACRSAGDRAGVHVIPGIEITSEEEVHVLGLLPSLEAAGGLQAEVYRALPDAASGPESLIGDRFSSARQPDSGESGHDVDFADAFGLQVIANDQGEVLGFNPHFLPGATRLSVDQVVARIHQVGGLAIASHADRETFGIVGQLGFIPPELPLDGVEISPNLSLQEGRRRFGRYGQMPILSSSDAHRPEDIGRCITYMLLGRPSFQEIRQALTGVDGRAVLGGGKPMEDLALHILDIAQNGLEAGATRVEIEITEDLAANRLTIQVADNGKGMDEATLQVVLDPFFTTRTTRRVGLGLPLLADSAHAAGGDLEVRSEPGKGTTTTAYFRLDHIDRAPLGDLQTTLLVLLAGSPETEIIFRHKRGQRDFSFSSSDLASVLGARSFSSPEGLSLIRGVLEQGEAGLTLTKQQTECSPKNAPNCSHGESI